MRKLLWLLLVASAFAQGPSASLDYKGDGPPAAGIAQAIGSRYVDLRAGQLYVCTSTTYANKAYTCTWTNIGTGSLASPGAIGSTTPSTGAFTTVTAASVNNLMNITSGAVCDGTTDDSTVLQANMTAAVGKIAYIPPGKVCATTVQLVLPTSSTTSLYISQGSSIKATAAMTAVVATDPANPVFWPEVWGGGTIDANGNANICLWLRYFRNAHVHNIELLSALVDGLRLGDNGAGGTSYGANVYDVWVFRPQASSVPANSIGIWLDAATDSVIGPGNVITGYQKGILTNTSSNLFTGNHPWDYTTTDLTIAFEDTGTGNVWTNNEADSPATYCFHTTAYNTVISENHCYNNTNAPDNALIGVQIDASGPFDTVVNNYFHGSNSSHRIATDVVSTNGLANILMFGNQETNVVTQVGNLYFNTWTLQKSAGSQLKFVDGANTGNTLTTGAADNGSGGVALNSEPTVKTSGQGASYRFCRSFNDSAGCQFNWFLGNNTSSLALAWSQAGKITTYNSIATTGGGLAAVRGAATVTTGSGASIGSTSLCSTTNCPVGLYDIHVYLEITTACTTTGTYQVNIIYTDDQGAKTITAPLTGTGTVSNVLGLASAANFGQANFPVYSTGAASINYSTTAGACGTGGPMIGKMYISASNAN